MAKLSANYEAMFIIDPRKNEEETAALVERFKTLAEGNATQVEVDEWGKRRLAYPIAKQPEGYYTLINFKSAPEFTAELDRIYKITDGVLRSLIVAKEEATQAEEA